MLSITSVRQVVKVSEMATCRLIRAPNFPTFQDNELVGIDGVTFFR